MCMYKLKLTLKVNRKETMGLISKVSLPRREL